jgi:hypothetical protein
MRCVFGNKAVKEIKKVSLSNDTVKKRIDDMLNVKISYCFLWKILIIIIIIIFIVIKSINKQTPQGVGIH